MCSISYYISHTTYNHPDPALIVNPSPYTVSMTIFENLNLAVFVGTSHKRISKYIYISNAFAVLDVFVLKVSAYSKYISSFVMYVRVCGLMSWVHTDLEHHQHSYQPTSSHSASTSHC